MIRVLYGFPPGVNPEKQGRMLAIGQTVGSFRPDEARRFESWTGVLEEASVDANGRGRALVAYPSANVSGDIGSLLVMILGKYSLAGPVRILSLDLPEGYGTRGRFGLAGIRELTGVRDRPLFMGIFKPALGLSPEDFAAILREVGMTGLDLIKDDEICPDTPASTALSRVRACRPVLDEIRRATGREMLYAVTLSGGASRMLDQARRLREAGANAYLVSPIACGFSVLESLASDPDTRLPIFAHPAMAGALGGSPDYGIDYRVLLGTLMIHGGADAVLYPTAAGSLPIDPGVEADLRRLLVASGLAPVPSAGIHPGALPKFLSPGDHRVILNAGTGLMDHPQGPAAGVRAFHEALELIKKSQPLDRDSVPEGPLRQAILKWGS